MLVSLRGRYPHAGIDWLVQEEFAPAIAHHPALSGVVPFPRNVFRRHRAGPSEMLRRLGSLLRALRIPRYDLVVDCQGLGRSALLALVTGAPHRVGYADAREGATLALTRRVDAPRTMHTVDRMMRLAQAVGGAETRDMRLYADPASHAEALGLTGEHPYALLAPTSRWPGKRWPADRFEHLARALLKAGVVERIAIVGSATEQDQCTPLIDLARLEPRILNLIGSTSVGTLMAIIERAALVVANDSAAVHIAVGFDRPLVALYGPTRIDLVGPYRREHDVLQGVPPPHSNRHKDERAGAADMSAITLERVLEASLARLDLGAMQRSGRSTT